MSKVYLLLRNNQQSGPYTLEEILKLKLKPFDLVWVNGRSAAWQYPGEIATLQPHVPPTPKNSIPFQPIATSALEGQQNDNSTYLDPVKPSIGTGKNVFVSLPKTDVSVKRTIEETFQASELKYTHSFEVPKVEISERKIIDQGKETTISYGYKSDTRKITSGKVHASSSKTKSIFNKKDMALVMLLIGFIVGGYYLISKPSLVQPAQQIEKRQIVKVQQQTGDEVKTEPIIENVAQDQILPAATLSIMKPVKKQKEITSQIPVEQKHKMIEVAQTSSGNKIQDGKNIQSEVAIVEKEKIELSIPKNAPSQTKSKKIGDVFKNILNKAKNKNEKPSDVAVVLEEPKPSPDRSSVHREEQPAPSSSTTKNESVTRDFTELVEVTSQSPDSWMMGINGLQVTLRNRSKTLIQTAAVSIQYYDANDNLLDKKLVYFNQIPAKGKLTLAAPDHKWADHTKITIASINTKEDRYARD